MSPTLMAQVKQENIKSAVNNSPAVKNARRAAATAKNNFENAKRRAASIVLDPVLEAIDTTPNILVINKVGFDTGLESLCKKKLPMLNIAGKFQNKSFNIKNALALQKMKSLILNFLEINCSQNLKSNVLESISLRNNNGFIPLYFQVTVLSVK